MQERPCVKPGHILKLRMVRIALAIWQYHDLHGIQLSTNENLLAHTLITTTTDFKTHGSLKNLSLTTFLCKCHVRTSQREQEHHILKIHLGLQ